MSTGRPTPWFYATWIFGAIVVASIAVALGATVWRMEQTYNIVDTDIATAEDYRNMIDTSLRWVRLGLSVGTPAVLLYLVSLVMHHRSRRPAPLADSQDGERA